MAELRSTLERMLAGNVQLVLLAGEPGIGKTRLAEAFTATALARECDVVWGRCDEWDGSPAYWPWIQILRSLMFDVDTALLRSWLGSGSGYLASLVPELADRLSLATELRHSEPAQARFALFECISALLRGAAATRPRVLAIDDLHWADTSSLSLLRFLARSLRDTPILFLVTYRHTDIDRQSPLTETLAALAREAGHLRVVLGGLSREDVADFIEQSDHAVSHEALTEAVYQATDGNAFFMHEVIRLLVGEAIRDHEELATRIPESVRDVVGQRVNRLPPTCKEQLAIAAVVGREFGLPILARVSGRSLPACIEAIEPAVAAHLIEPRGPGRYRFNHALVRETLYEELRITRRLRLHLQIGEALEGLPSSDLTAHTAELAHHFSIAAPMGCADKAIDYALTAAGVAMSQYAWETAIEQYQQALQAFELLETPNPLEQCDVLLALGETQNQAGAGREHASLAGVSPEAETTFWRAAALARAADAPERLARAALGIVGANVSAPQGGVPGMALMEEALAAVPNEDSALRARLLARLATALTRFAIVGEPAVAAMSLTDLRQQCEAAVAMARRLADPATVAYTLAARSIAHEGPDYEGDRIADANEIIRYAGIAGDLQLGIHGLQRSYDAFVERGQMYRARQIHSEIARLAEQARTPWLSHSVLIHSAGDSLRTGRFSDVEAFIDRSRAIWPETAVATIQMATLRREQDWLDEGLAAVITRLNRFPHAPAWRAYRLVLLAESGQCRAAQVGFDEMASNGFRNLRRTATWLWMMARLAEVATMLDDQDRAIDLYRLLVPYADRNIFVGNSDHTGGSVAYYLGMLATTLERWEDAEGYVETALANNMQWEQWPYVAHTQHAWASLLLRRGMSSDRQRALALNEDALQAARQMGMARLARYAHAVHDSVAIAGDGVMAAHDRYGLSAREVEVLRLIIQGSSDREIGTALSISPRTVGSHVSNILGKLGTRTRTEAAAMAVRDDLV